MRIAILALQGAFIEHERMMRGLGCDVFEIRKLSDWNQPKDGLIIPGGESTVQSKLLNELGLSVPIRNAIISGLPVMGTCAGLILLAEQVENGNSSMGLSTMPIEVCRNAYGRQLGSFYHPCSVHKESIRKRARHGRARRSDCRGKTGEPACHVFSSRVN